MYIVYRITSFPRDAIFAKLCGKVSIAKNTLEPARKNHPLRPLCRVQTCILHHSLCLSIEFYWFYICIAYLTITHHYISLFIKLI